MNFVNHSELKGLHAFLSASSYHWVRYSDEKLIERYKSHRAKELGTQLHDWADQTIRLGIKQKDSNQTINMYVNDAIGFRMKTEQILFYSINCFGTADAISFRDNVLRIHDLKTGSTPAHMEQLMIYAALFCLEYKYNPADIEIHLRIYQNDDVLCYDPTDEEILFIMGKIVDFDKLITKYQREETGI